MPRNILDMVAIQQERQVLLDECEAIQAVATDEKRDLSDDEQTLVDEKLALHETMQADVDRARKFEEAKAAAAARRTVGDPAPTGDGFQPPPKKAEPARPRAMHALKAFSGPNAEQDAHDAGMFCKAVLLGEEDANVYCRDHGLIQADGQTADDFDKGGSLVPDGFSSAIIRIVTEVGLAPRVADMYPMTSETDSVGKFGSGLTVYSPKEGADITTSEITHSRVSLAATDRFTLTRISLKLLRGSAVSMGDRVATEIGYAKALQMDKEFINGDGTSTYFGEYGLVPSIGAAGVETGTTTSQDTWPELDLGNHHAAMSFLPSRYWINPVWICSRAYYNAVMVRLAAAAGGNTIQNLENGMTREAFLGYPVLFTDQMPTATAVSTVSCLFGGFMAAVTIGDRAGVAIAASEHQYFKSAEIAIRGIWSYDINVHEPGDASNAGAYVAVKTGAAS